MDYSEACEELARLIQTGHYKYIEEAGQAIQLLGMMFDEGDDPAMCLAMAKNVGSMTKVGD